MKIGVIGVGVVGGATMEAFRQRGMNVVGYDPNKEGMKSVEPVLATDVVFVCVPTATDRKTGEQDLYPLEVTLKMLYTNSYRGVIVVKSTVLPGTTEKLSFKYSLETQVVHNPEFLTAARPLEDFLEQPLVVIGGLYSPAVKCVADVYKKAGFPNLALFDSAKKSELAKYMHNLGLSVKVMFLNEMYDMCDAHDCDYTEIKNAVVKMGGIGPGHTKVPGPDGQFGFGGMCFPKDTLAFLTFAQKNGFTLDVLDATVRGNKRRRPEEYE